MAGMGRGLDRAGNEPKIPFLYPRVAARMRERDLLSLLYPRQRSMGGKEMQFYRAGPP